MSNANVYCRKKILSMQKFKRTVLTCLLVPQIVSMLVLTNEAAKYSMQTTVLPRYTLGLDWLAYTWMAGFDRQVNKIELLPFTSCRAALIFYF